MEVSLEQHEEYCFSDYNNINTRPLLCFPGHLKAGFESITRKDSEVYLRFLASDLLEGREVASRGYDIAAEYAATTFRLWGLEPAGDKKGKKKERAFFQEVPAKEILQPECDIFKDPVCRCQRGRGDYIFNGADDNASGCAAVMEIAQAFAANKVKPKRSVLFALWTGEEGPLLGSRHYVSHPFFPLKKTAAYINLDMISREWGLKDYGKWQKRYGVELPEKLSEIVSMPDFSPWEFSRSPEIFETLKKNNRFVGLHIHFRQSDSAGGGSDHAAFDFHRIPWVCSFGAVTEDYHQPSDSAAKVSFNLIEKNARLMWLTAFSLADKE